MRPTIVVAIPLCECGNITLPVQNWSAERFRANDNARALDPIPANVLRYRKRTDIRHYGMWVPRPFVMESAEMADRLLPVTALRGTLLSQMRRKTC